MQARNSIIVLSESVDGYRRVSELALQCGHQRRNKEMLGWIKKRRKHIRYLSVAVTIVPVFSSRGLDD